MGQTNSTNNSVNYNLSNSNVSETITVGLLCERNIYRFRNGTTTSNSINHTKARVDLIKKFIVDNLIKRDNINIENIKWETIDLEDSNIIVHTNAAYKPFDPPEELHNKYDIIFGIACPVTTYTWIDSFQYVYKILKPNGILGFFVSSTENNYNLLLNKYKQNMSELRQYINTLRQNPDINFKGSFTNPKYSKESIYSGKTGVVVVLKKKNIDGGGKKKFTAKNIKKKVTKNNKNSKK